MPKGVNAERVCQKTAAEADVGWLLEYGVPDEIIPMSDGHALLRYGNVIVNMEACTDGISLVEFEQFIAERKGGKK